MCISRFYKRISGGKDLGDPAKAQRQRVWWGKEESPKGISFGHSGATELLPPKGQNEGYEACDDAIRRRICAVLPYAVTIFSAVPTRVSSRFPSASANATGLPSSRSKSRWSVRTP